jgi:AcrR family transcriptional regulator
MQETRARIFDTAMELFKDKGFEDTQVSEIAEKAGIGKGTFFNYFPTKESLFGFIGKANMDALKGAVAAGSASSRSVKEILEDQAKRIGAWADSNREVIRLAIAARFFSFAGGGGSSDARMELRTVMESLIERGRRSGEFSPKLPTRTAALAIEGAYFAIMSDWARDGEGGSLASLLAEGLSVLFSGMLA